MPTLRCKSPQDLWTADLDKLLVDYEQFEQDEERKANNQGPKPKGKKGVGKAVMKKKAARYSAYLLFWYNSTNTDAEGAAASKRRKSWGASDVSDEDDDDDFLHDGSDRSAPASLSFKSGYFVCLSGLLLPL